MHVALGVAPHVADMAQQVALGVLRHGLAEMRADSPVDEADLLGRIAIARQAADQHDAQAVLDLGLQQAQRAGKAPEREMLLANVGNLPAEFLDVAQRRVELGDLVVAQAVDPALAVRMSCPSQAERVITSSRSNSVHRFLPAGVSTLHNIDITSQTGWQQASYDATAS